ncbi:septum formation inhibitor Maf [Rosenbergiella sp. S61]|uniref:7-methyl-GTP pyrophosphatase n=1 Tax=Rosenbergiella gaditana TaxID=2726987 RepID=A0ABS5STC0_9GAMM|nr:nucleoside triphosphate pyrophosphatase [Rosenbergiella gaditana]MBT0723335.1 septum formation inhibitor Maf [Rosenbergiella gaditana]
MSYNLVLASSSPFRQAVLDKLGLPFFCAAPDIDEAAAPSESIDEQVLRLAREKASALIERYPDSVIIGCDQLGSLAEQVLGKPHTPEQAFTQLRASSGQCVTFHTGLAVYDGVNDCWHQSQETYQVFFRELTDNEIWGYIRKEQPLQCAGSFKSEGLGITLFDKMAGDDPNTLVGLPLIALSRILRKIGINPLTD